MPRHSLPLRSQIHLSSIIIYMTVEYALVQTMCRDSLLDLILIQRENAILLFQIKELLTMNL